MEATVHSQGYGQSPGYGRSSAVLSIRNWLFYSTIVMVLWGMTAIMPHSTTRLYQVLCLVNLVLMLLVRPIRIHRAILGLLAILAFSGVVGLYQGTDTGFAIAKQLIGIGLMAVYFYNFFRMENARFERPFYWYLLLARIMTYAGYMQTVVMTLHEHMYFRMTGLTEEPSFYVYACLPAWYWFAYKWFRHKQCGREFIELTVGFMLALSSLGILGMGMGVLLLFSRRVWVAPVVGTLVLGLGVGVYLTVPAFQMRVFDSAIALQEGDVSSANLSSYALISNLFVMERVLEEHPWLGNGLGSHVISHKRFIGDVPGVEAFLSNDAIDLNSEDAASLATRTLSEGGVVGLILVVVLFFWFYVRDEGDAGAISNAMLCYLLLRLLRGGHYFPPEGAFFFSIYVINARRLRRARKAGLKTLPPLELTA